MLMASKKIYKNIGGLLALLTSILTDNFAYFFTEVVGTYLDKLAWKYMYSHYGMHITLKLLCASDNVHHANMSV